MGLHTFQYSAIVACIIAYAVVTALDEAKTRKHVAWSLHFLSGVRRVIE